MIVPTILSCIMSLLVYFRSFFTSLYSYVKVSCVFVFALVDVVKWLVRFSN